MRTRLSRRHGRALLPLLVALALSLGATAVAGVQPSIPSALPDSAFVPVTIDAPGDPPSDDAAASARGAPPIADPWLVASETAGRAQPALPDPKPITVTRPAATQKPTTQTSTSTSSGAGSTSHSISGAASWYCYAGVSACTSGYPDTTGFDAYAAAGPRLRAAIGSSWRGKVVTVDGIRVKLIDWCQCYQGESNEKLLDLYHDVFLRTGSSVTIRW